MEKSKRRFFNALIFSLYIIQYLQTVNRTSIISIIAAILVTLWIYASVSKLLDMENSRREMLNQVFSNDIARMLTWIVPAAELTTSAMLLFTKTKIMGFYASAFLLLSFTVYIVLVMSNVFGRIPCSCGGILEKMSWGQHLAFNIFFIGITFIAIMLSRKHTAFAKEIFINRKGGDRQT